MALKTSEPRSAPSTLAVAGEKNGMASVDPGCWPDDPTAPRKRRSDSQLTGGKKPSSATPQATPDYSAVHFPKLSAPWVDSGESFLPPLTLVCVLRLRVAVGQYDRVPQR